MADKNLTVEIVTPERLVYSEPAEMVVAPGVEGYLGILPLHAPIVSGLEIGVLKVVAGGKESKLAISGGFMEVSNDKVVILADTAERGDEVDVLRAKSARERAEQRLTNRTSDIDAARAESSLRRAVARLKAAGQDN
ncbi:MAG TPA: F0F1 ATP synthase subunit epsilon [Desulfobacteria bacterium]|nr:F0F1 ATP synthase subunit epsilon [Desulfobacteria bacterium]